MCTHKQVCKDLVAENEFWIHLAPGAWACRSGACSPGQTFGGTGRARSFCFFSRLMALLHLFFFPKKSRRVQKYLFTHIVRDNVVYWKTNGKINNDLQLWPKLSVIIHWPGETFGTHTLKLAYPCRSCTARRPTARRGLKLQGKHLSERKTGSSQFAWVDNHCHRHLQEVNILCRVPPLKRGTRRILIHTIQPPRDHKSTLSIIEARTLVILPLVGLQFKLFLAACSITRISKLAEPVMTGTQVLLLVNQPIYGTYLCIYVYMYIYMWTLCIWIFNTYIYTHTCINRCTNIHTHTYTCTHIIYNIHKYVYHDVYLRSLSLVSISLSPFSLSLSLSLSPPFCLSSLPLSRSRAVSL